MTRTVAPSALWESRRLLSSEMLTFHQRLQALRPFVSELTCNLSDSPATHSA